MEQKDYYRILGVSRNASADQIKRAYRTLARRYHPDVSTEPNAEHQFKAINEAYEVLGDAKKRKDYDALGAGWRTTKTNRASTGGAKHSKADFDLSSDDIDQFSDFFSGLFGRGFRRRREPPPAKKPKMNQSAVSPQQRVQITLEDAHQGLVRQIQLEPPANSSAAPRTLKVHIPPGVVHGQQIRLAKQGEDKSDVFLEIELAPHPLYRAEGKNIHLTLRLAPWEAALGATLSVPTLGGSVKLQIPPQSQNGQRLRLKGRGLPGKPPGDTLVHLEIVNPTTKHARQRAAWQKLADLFTDFNPRANLDF